MATGIELATAYISIVPEMGKVSKSLRSAFEGSNSEAERGGRELGKRYGDAIASSVADASERVKTEVTEATRAVETHSRSVETARAKEETAAKQLAIAEARLQEARDKGTTSSSSLMSAELAVERAKDRHATASNGLAEAQTKLVGAQERQKVATDAAAKAAESLTGDEKRATSEASRMQKALSSAGDKGKAAAGKIKGAFKGIGASIKDAVTSPLGAGALGAAGAVFIKDAVAEAGNLEQSIGGVRAVFKENFEQIDVAARGAATSMGLSRNEYNELATALGAGLKNKGIEDFAGQTKNLIALGGDLSAQFGGSTKEAVEALTSALRGESDPIDRYGVELNETAVNAKLAQMGIEKTGDAYTAQQKTMARLAIIQEQTTDAQGAAGREAKSLASQQANLKAQFANVKGELGMALLPALSSLAQVFTVHVLPAFKSFIDNLRSGEGVVGKIGAAIKAVAGFLLEHKTLVLGAVAAYAGFKVVSGTISAVNTVMGVARGIQQGYALATYGAASATGAQTTAEKVGMAVQKAKMIVTKGVTLATQAYAAAVRLLSAAWRANPIGLVVTALLALGAGLVLLYKKNETFRNAVNAAWAAIKSAVSSVKDWIVNVAWPALKGAFEAIAGAMTAAKDGIVGAWDKVKGAFTAAKDWIVGTALPALKDAIGKIAGYIPIVAVIQNWDKIKAAFTAAKDWVKDKFSLLWAGVKQIVTSPIDSAKQVVERLLGATGLRDTFTRVWNWAKGTFSLLWAGAKKIFTDPIDSAKTVISNLLGATGLRDVITRVWNWAKDKFSQMWSGIKKIFTDPIASAKKIISDLLGATGLQDVFTKARDAIGRIWGKIKDKIKGPLEKVLSLINSGFVKPLNKMFDAVNLDLKIPELVLGDAFASGGPVPPRKGGTSGLQRASGGPVPGWSPNDKADNIPAWLTAGEYVTRVAATRSMERNHPGALAYINKHGRLPGYAIGGKVGGLNPKFLSALAAFNKAAGGRFSVISGLRTRAEQERLYALYLSGRGNLAAKPGTSRHETGDAADLSPSSARDTHGALAKKFGLHFPVPGEAWHVELIGGGGGGGGGVGSFLKGLAAKVFSEGKSALTALVDKLPSAPAPWMPAGKNAAKMIIDAAFEKFMGGASAMGAAGDGSAPAGIGGGGSFGGGVQRWRSTVVEALKRTGLPTSSAYVSAWLRQIQSESGGNPNIAQQIRDVNGTGESAGVGLVQVIPDTFAAFRDKGLPNDRRNPLANLVAGMNWAKFRYPGRMLNVIGHGHGYADGGLVKPAVFDMGGTLAPGFNLVHNKLGRPEPLVRADLPHPGLDGARFDLVVEDGTVLRAYVRSQASAAARADAAASRSRLPVGGAL